MRVKLVGFAIFIIFFGAAALDAFATHNWTRSIFWLAIGLLFLIADNIRKAVATK